MTPHEVLDYEIGAKRPTTEIIDRLADALGADPYELISASPEQAAARRLEEEQENARIAEELEKRGAGEKLEDRSNPGWRTLRDAYEKNDAREHQAERGREDRLA